MPPRRIWLDGKAVKEWFEEMDRRREERMRNPGHDIEDPVENEAAAGLIYG